MSDQQTQRPAKVETLLNSSKLRLSAQNPANKKYANLSVDLYRSNPRIIVNTNDDALRNENDGWGKITAAMDPLLINILIEKLRLIAQSKEPTRVALENYNHSYSGGQRSQDIAHLNTVWIGRDDQGVVYISVVHVDQKFPRIKFPFGPSDNRYGRFKGADGNELSRAELSSMSALGWCAVMQDALNYLMVTTYEAPPKPQGKFGGGGNRGNYGGGNRGNYGGGNRGGYGGGQREQAKPSESFDGGGAGGDDDIPF